MELGKKQKHSMMQIITGNICTNTSQYLGSLN